MIGYYAHHVGRGHLQRAVALGEEMRRRGGPEVVGLSSGPPPPGWTGRWVRLARDDDGPDGAGGSGRGGAGANGRLHWAPVGHAGLRRRSAQLSSWIETERPDAVVVDVSVEVTALVRLHGVPVVGVVLPGERGDDAHRLGLDLSSALVGFWPERATAMLGGLPDRVARRVRAVGALSSRTAAPPGHDDAVDADGPRGGRRRRVVLLAGAGGVDHTETDVAAAVAATPGWSWTVLGGTGRWVADPMPALRAADVVVTHAGQNALAEVAVAARPAVVVPQQRPHEEQTTTARSLRGLDLPVVVVPRWPCEGWPGLLERTARLDGSRWSGWVQPEAVGRFADVVADVVAEVAGG